MRARRGPDLVETAMARIIGGALPGKRAGRDRPGGVVASTTGKATANQLACRCVARRVEPGYGGRAGVVDDPKPAGAPHRTFKPQGDWKAVRERIEAGAIEGQEKIRLRNPHLALHVAIGLVEPGIDRALRQRTGDCRPAAL